jgi:hypothetical protein
MNNSLRHNWNIALGNVSFRVQFIGTIITLILLAIFIPHFFNYIQHRSGFVLHDPILHIMTPQDCSWITFTLIYVSLLLGLIDFFQRPEQLILALQAYCIMNFLRIISLLVVPLDEPIAIIVMRDPFVAVVGYGGNVITKDLFFSGHVATMTLLVLVVTNRGLKSVLFGTTIVIASLLLVQHVHYTIDVLVAPIFSYVSFRLSKLLAINLHGCEGRMPPERGPPDVRPCDGGGDGGR